MARRTFVRTALRQGQRRKTLWLFVGPIFQVNSTTATLVVSLNAIALAFRPFTIVRTRLEAHFFSDQVAGAENTLGALGLAIVSSEASAVGVTAVPTPITEMGSDLWFVHQVMIASHGAGVVDNARGVRYSIDSKAMRKVEDGQDMVVVTENSTIAGGQTMMVAGRILIKMN